MADVKIDFSKYQKTEDPEVEGWTYYVNKDEGLVVSVYHDLATEYEFVPTARDNKTRCASAVTDRTRKGP